MRFDTSEERLQLQGIGQTVGLVRALWKFDVRHRALADAATLRPITMHQVEEVRSKTVTDRCRLQTRLELSGSVPIPNQKSA